MKFEDAAGMVGQDANNLLDGAMPEVKQFDKDKLEKLMQQDEKARVAVNAYLLAEDVGALIKSMDGTGKSSIEVDVLVQGSFWGNTKITTEGLGSTAFMAYKLAASPMIGMAAGALTEALEEM